MELPAASCGIILEETRVYSMTASVLERWFICILGKITGFPASSNSKFGLCRQKQLWHIQQGDDGVHFRKPHLFKLMIHIVLTVCRSWNISLYSAFFRPPSPRGSRIWLRWSLVRRASLFCCVRADGVCHYWRLPAWNPAGGEAGRCSSARYHWRRPRGNILVFFFFFFFWWPYLQPERRLIRQRQKLLSSDKVIVEVK